MGVQGSQKARFRVTERLPLLFFAMSLGFESGLLGSLSTGDKLIILTYFISVGLWIPVRSWLVQVYRNCYDFYLEYPETRNVLCIFLTLKKTP